MVIFLNSVDLIFKSDISITNGCIPSSKFISNHLNNNDLKESKKSLGLFIRNFEFFFFPLVFSSTFDRILN